MTALDGTCACGAVAFTATPKDMTAGACHCDTCRKWSGGVFLSVDCGSSVTIDDAAPIRVWVSSDWGERVSCAVCGSSLIWRGRDLQSWQVSIQAFADPGQFALDHEIYVDSKPRGYDFANDTRKMTGAEVMAMFAAPPQGEQ